MIGVRLYQLENEDEKHHVRAVLDVAELEMRAAAVDVVRNH